MEKISKTGVFKIENGDFFAIDETPNKGSINDFIKHIGQKVEETYLIFCSPSRSLSWVVVSVFDMQPLIVCAKDKMKHLSAEDINEDLKKIDWEFEKRQATSEYLNHLKKIK